MQIIIKGHVIDLFLGLIECTPVETGSPEQMVSVGNQQVSFRLRTYSTLSAERAPLLRPGSLVRFATENLKVTTRGHHSNTWTLKLQHLILYATP